MSDFHRSVNGSLLELPLDVANLVFEKFDPIELLSLRKVCRSLRTALDKFGIRFDTIRFEMGFGYFEVTLDDHAIKYYRADFNCTIVTYKNQKTEIKSENFEIVAFKDLEIISKQVSRLEMINEAEGDFDFLKSLECLYAKEISLRKFSLDEAISILQYFNAQTVEVIELRDAYRIEDFESISKLDQWKNAQVFELWHSEFHGNLIHQLFHFQCFTVSNIIEFSTQMAVEIRDDLMKRSTFLWCDIHYDSVKSDPIEIAKVFGFDYSGSDGNTFEYSQDIDEFAIQFRRIDNETSSFAVTKY